MAYPYNPQHQRFADLKPDTVTNTKRNEFCDNHRRKIETYFVLSRDIRSFRIVHSTRFGDCASMRKCSRYTTDRQWFRNTLQVCIPSTKGALSDHGFKLVCWGGCYLWKLYLLPAYLIIWITNCMLAGILHSHFWMCLKAEIFPMSYHMRFCTFGQASY